MNSKTIKISVLIIVMLFFVGLFNSVFAYSFDVDNYTVKFEFGKNTNRAKFVYAGIYPVDFDRLNTSNVQYNSNGLYTSYINDSSKIYTINFEDNNLYCYCLGYDSNNKCYSQSVSFYGYDSVSKTFMGAYNNFKGYNFYIYVYDFDNKCWNFSKSSTDFLAYNMIGFDGEVKFYDDVNSDTANLIFDSSNFIEEKNLTDEELISNCDFKVNFNFNPPGKDYPVGFDKHMYLYENCVVTHSMSNWSNYIVNMSVSLNKEKTYNGDDTYFEYYNSAGKKIVDKTKLYYNKVEKTVVNEGDFYGLFSDNIADVVKINYEICNKSGNLLLKKEYLVKFSHGGSFFETDSTGTILKETTFDSSGNLIESTDKSFNTNGFDQTDINKDYTGDVSDITGLTSSATETIKLAKECFSILPGFIWAMVGIFLSTCIALRILGR